MGKKMELLPRQVNLAPLQVQDCSERSGGERADLVPALDVTLEGYTRKTAVVFILTGVLASSTPRIPTLVCMLWL